MDQDKSEQERKKMAEILNLSKDSPPKKGMAKSRSLDDRQDENRPPAIIDEDRIITEKKRPTSIQIADPRGKPPVSVLQSLTTSMEERFTPETIPKQLQERFSCLPAYQPCRDREVATLISHVDSNAEKDELSEEGSSKVVLPEDKILNIVVGELEGTESEIILSLRGNAGGHTNMPNLEERLNCLPSNLIADEIDASFNELDISCCSEEVLMPEVKEELSFKVDTTTPLRECPSIKGEDSSFIEGKMDDQGLPTFITSATPKKRGIPRLRKGATICTTPRVGFLYTSSRIPTPTRKIPSVSPSKSLSHRPLRYVGTPPSLRQRFFSPKTSAHSNLPTPEKGNRYAHVQSSIRRNLEDKPVPAFIKNIYSNRPLTKLKARSNVTADKTKTACASQKLPVAKYTSTIDKPFKAPATKIITPRVVRHQGASKANWDMSQLHEEDTPGPSTTMDESTREEVDVVRTKTLK